eukprot:TRINITY_DN9227_c0_g1_i1.p1 TRINITY_DN9227_c0_g1~~TRINITY_DN9227_c0_g1_i1.p1  ORF type:complete len:584 (-),score=119.27 TRINITY_DN9227_c0_g1_i1:85-1836(-)
MADIPIISLDSTKDEKLMEEISLVELDIDNNIPFMDTFDKDVNSISHNSQNNDSKTEKHYNISFDQYLQKIFVMKKRNSSHMIDYDKIDEYLLNNPLITSKMLINCACDYSLFLKISNYVDDINVLNTLNDYDLISLSTSNKYKNDLFLFSEYQKSKKTLKDFLIEKQVIVDFEDLLKFGSVINVNIRHGFQLFSNLTQFDFTHTFLGQTCLHDAMYSRSSRDTVEQLLDLNLKMEINSCSAYPLLNVCGTTPLCWAVVYYPEIVDFLLLKGCDPNTYHSDSKVLPIHFALELGYDDVFFKLLPLTTNFKIDEPLVDSKLWNNFSSQNIHSNFPLDVLTVACLTENLKFVERLSKIRLSGANLSILPLVIALKQNNKQMFELLLEMGLPTNGTFSFPIIHPSPITLLHYCIKFDFDEFTAMLLDNNADIHAKQELVSSPHSFAKKIFSQDSYNRSSAMVIDWHISLVDKTDPTIVLEEWYNDRQILEAKKREPILSFDELDVEQDVFKDANKEINTDPTNVEIELTDKNRKVVESKKKESNVTQQKLIAKRMLQEINNPSNNHKNDSHSKQSLFNIISVVEDK